MKQETSIAKIDEATRALELAKTIPEVMKWRSRAQGFIVAITKEYKEALTMQDGTDDKKISYESALKAGGFQLKVEARLGELIQLEQKAGKLATQDRSKMANTDVRLLKDYGLTWQDSSRAQKIADHKELIEQVVASATKLQDIPTKQAIFRLVTDLKRKAKLVENQALVEQASPIPTDIFKTVLIDPPWDWGDEKDISQFGRATPTFVTQPLEKLLELPIPAITEKDAHLYLCITNRSLPKGFQLLEHWGFRYITLLTWCKPHFGMGNYFRGQTEHIIFGVKGSCPLLRHDVGTWFAADRKSNHSGKPEKLYEIIESCSPGPWLEMFARSQRQGWVAWGAEIGKL